MTAAPTVLLTLWALFAGAVTPALAQAPDAGSISGTVIDIDSHSALAGALVTIQPEPAGLFPAATQSPSGLPATARTQMTDSTGAYRFTGLLEGRYRLDAARPGYRAYSVVVELRGPAESTVGVGLSMRPIQLEPLRLMARREDPFPRGHQQRFEPIPAPAWAHLRLTSPLSTDAVELTRADVTEAVTAGEPDLFRAIQRLPGIATLSDYTAELWTRGASWGQTRVYFDGVPLFDPLHGMGAVTGISPEAVGALWVYPGVHPVALPEGAAGAVELKTRRGAGEGRLNGAADVSLVSAEVALDQRASDDRAAWMLAARRSSLDWLTHVAARVMSDSDLRVPYDFRDAVGRLDLRLGASHTLEASGLAGVDYWRGRDLDAVPRGNARWVNLVGRVALVSRLRAAEIRHAVGISRRTGNVFASGAAAPADGPGPLWPDAALPTATKIAYVSLSGEWRALSPRAGWAAGYDVVREEAAYEGPSAEGLPLFVAEMWRTDTLSLRRRPLWVFGGWLERTWSPGERLTLQPALRVEVAEHVRGSGPVRAAPHLTARYQVRPEVALSVGLGRTWQYAQPLAPTGIRKASLSSDDIWLIAGSDVPALHADIVTLGAEVWLAHAWRLTANGFVRRSGGVVFPDPTPGPVTAPRAAFVSADAAALGAEAAIHRVASTWSVSAAYSLSRSMMNASGLRFPAGADRRHVFDASGMIRPIPALGLGGAFTAASGLPYTSVEQQVIGGAPVSRLGPPNAMRGPRYASLDLLLDWTASLGGREIGGYVQLRNALGRKNRTVYVDSQPGCVLGWCGPRAILGNRYETGLPRLPVIGFRVRF
ncbi:MAG TPA: TonB-dependent receptor [Longimicrobiales bacterium]|nr:TonB-dependent receptor [Longimicrobiales bacterium]